jgi:glutathione S-transferase/GST-like protein
MYTLYARNGAGSMAPEALLAALGASCEVVTVERDADGRFPDFFHKLNPRAEVPTLVLPDKSIMTESAAMMIHLADLHPEAGLAPLPGTPERASYLRWMLYLATTLYMSDLRFFYPARYSADDGAADGIKRRAEQHMMQEYAVYADALGQGPFILGRRMCATDIYAAMLCTWAPDVPAFFAQHPGLKRMHDAVLENPAIAAVWKRNGL